MPITSNLGHKTYKVNAGYKLQMLRTSEYNINNVLQATEIGFKLRSHLGLKRALQHWKSTCFQILLSWVFKCQSSCSIIFLIGYMYGFEVSGQLLM